MALYSYQHPVTKEIKEIVQCMNDDHQFVDEKGVKWERLWTKPTAAQNTQFDPFDSKDFISKTHGKVGTLGNLMDKSLELSQKRQAIAGFDKVKEQWFNRYSKIRRGKLHEDDPRRKRELEITI